MGERVLRSSVYLDGTEYRAGTAEADLPDGVADRIVNPKAWQDRAEADAEAAVVAAGEGITSIGSVGAPASPVVRMGTAAAANLTDAADGPPAPPAEQVEMVADPAADPDLVPPPGAGNGDGAEAPQPPPMGGPGSGGDAWRAYAADVGVDVDPDAGRDDVVAALRDAGKPVDRSA